MKNGGMKHQLYDIIVIVRYTLLASKIGNIIGIRNGTTIAD
jgi:hypothetical protein